MTVRLSIVIPTYNGSRYIREALDSVISQLEDIDEEIEIVISDNASTDQTPEIIRDYQRKYPFIKYFRNEENVGADSNFDLAIRRSTGKYVWLFSDDDKLKGSAIRKVLEVLGKYPNIGLIWVNYGIYNEDFSVCRMERRDLKTMEDVYCSSADEFYTTTHILSTGCSTNIVKRSAWNNVGKDRFIGSGFIHVGVVGSYLIKENNAYCINYPYVMIRQPRISRWANKGKVLINGINLASIIRGFAKQGYKEDTVNRLMDRARDGIWKVCFSAKLQNVNLDSSLLKAMIKNYGKYPSFWLIDLPILLLPNHIYKVSKWMYYRMVKKRHKNQKGELS
ncbi:MAG: Abequosyltransferase RfbV [candidate division WS2 bacterium]|nr:Abequosyltransferase RfbV [Candidatus Psychracetigena formicireducens]